MATDLLRQILADPSEASLRMVYADALMAAGDPRGELIVAETTGDHVRRNALRAAHAATWWPELPLHRLRTRRGFVEGIATGDIDACGRLFATEPISHVELDGTFAFAPAPWQRHVTRLGIRGPLRRDELADLVASPLAEQLVELDLTGALRSGAVAFGERLSRCTRLRLACAPLAHQVGTLLRWQHLHGLEELDLRSCHLDADILDELLAQDLPKLRVLELSGNLLGDAGTEVLQRRLRHLPRLETLTLVDCEVTDITHAALIERWDVPLVFDLFGAAIELEPTLPGSFAVVVDGIRQQLRVRHLVTVDGNPQQVVSDWRAADDSRLTELARTVATGIDYRLTPTGAIVLLGSAVDVAYERVIATRETVQLRFGDPLELEYERHVTNDE